MVGLSATLSHCYPNVIRVTKILRELFPDIWIVVGGHLTGSSNVVLRKTETDICIVGDGEIPFVKLLDYFKLHPTRRQLDFTGLQQIKGLAFIDENNKLKVTGNAEQLSASEMPFPDYDKHRLGLQEYGGNGELIHGFFKPINELIDLREILQRQQEARGLRLKLYEKLKNKKTATIFSSRGCVARCTFCQRGQEGYRAYAASDLENHVVELKEKYNAGVIKVGDENFGSNKKQSYEFARIMKKHDFIWAPCGVRCTSVTYEDLKFYKEHNMVSIRFGIESGSQQMLDIMEKKATTKDIYNAVLNCNKAGVFTDPDAIILCMPGETEKTVKESAEFLALLWFVLGGDNGWNIYTTSQAMAFPGTPLYEYCQQIGIIGKSLEEEEDYLVRTSEGSKKSILNYLNKTDSSTKEVHYWLYLFHYAAKKAYVKLIIKNNKSIKNSLLQIYEQCIKAAFNDLISNFNLRKGFYKNKKFLQKIKWYILSLTDFLLSLGVLFLPKIVFFPILRVYANSRFYYLRKIHKVKKGKQKYNLFVDRRDVSANGLRISENRIAKTSRQIDRSLRTIVMENRRQMKTAITDEEKGLQILAEAQ